MDTHFGLQPPLNYGTRLAARSRWVGEPPKGWETAVWHPCPRQFIPPLVHREPEPAVPALALLRKWQSLQSVWRSWGSQPALRTPPSPAAWITRHRKRSAGSRRPIFATHCASSKCHPMRTARAGNGSRQLVKRPSSGSGHSSTYPRTPSPCWEADRSHPAGVGASFNFRNNAPKRASPRIWSSI